tara:strand:- start:462 stop:779 length:318 start_codon:yes stop_codon:yes gene_type:complete
MGIEHYEHFVEPGTHRDATSLLVKLDEIIRMHGGFSWETLMKNEEAFRQSLGDFMLQVVKENLDVDTVKEDSEHKGKIGNFPKWEGEPGITHMIWELRPRELKRD